MAVKQIGLPDISTLSISGTTIQLMEAVTFSDDGQHLVVRATYTEDGGMGQLHYGYFVYDISAEAYVLNLNEHLLDSSRLTTSIIETLHFNGNLADFNIVAKIKDAGAETARVVQADNSGVLSQDVLLDVLGIDFGINVESFVLAEDNRHLVIQTSNPNLASVLNPDTNDSSDIYLIDLVTQEVTRVSEIGGAEVSSDTFLKSVTIIDGVLKIGFVTDEAYASISRIDQNTTDTSGPIGTRTDAYTWEAHLNSDGSVSTNIDFNLISKLPNGTASGFVDDESTVLITTKGAYFSSSSEFIDESDANNAIDGFVTGVDTTQRLSFAGEVFDAETKIVDSDPTGRYVLALSLSSNVTGATGAQQLVWIDTLNNDVNVLSANAAGTAGDNFTINGVIANAGNQIAFTSLASNLTNEFPNTFAGSLFINEIEGFNNPVEGQVELDGLPLLGQELALDFSGLMDADGIGDLGDIEVRWFKDDVLQEASGQILDTSNDSVGTQYSAQVSYVDGNGTTEVVDVPSFGLFDRPTLDNGSLGYTSKYIVFESDGESFFDFDLGFADINYDGQSSLFSGFSNVESINISSGQILDATNLKGSSDKIYLPGTLEQYLEYSSINASTGTITLINNSNFTYTEVKFIATNTASDDLIFADGKVSSATLKTYFLANKPDNFDFGIDSSVTSININADASISNVKAIAIDENGETFTSFTPQSVLQVSGGSGVDRVYVKQGTIVDATNLKGSVDEIYMQGRWSDYAKNFDASGNLILTRDLQINDSTATESISVASGTTVATNDLLVFADGAIRIKAAVTAIRAENTSDFSTLEGFDGSKVTPLENPDLPATTSGKVLNVNLGDPSSEIGNALIEAIDDIPSVTESYSLNETRHFNSEQIEESVDDTSQFELYF